MSQTNIEFIEDCLYKQQYANELLTSLDIDFKFIDKLVAVKQNLETHGYDASVMSLIKNDTVMMEALMLTDEDLNKSEAGVCENFIAAAWNAIIKAIDWVLDKLFAFFNWVWNFFAVAGRERDNINELNTALKYWDTLKPTVQLQPRNPNNPEPWLVPASFQRIKDGYRKIEAVHAVLLKQYKPFTQLKGAWATGKQDIFSAIHNITEFKSIQDAHEKDTIYNHYREVVLDNCKKLDTTITIAEGGTVKLTPPTIELKEARIKSDLGITYGREITEARTLSANCKNIHKQYGTQVLSIAAWCKTIRTWVKQVYESNDPVKLAEWQNYDQDKTLMKLLDLFKAASVIGNTSMQMSCVMLNTYNEALSKVEDAVMFGLK